MLASRRTYAVRALGADAFSLLGGDADYVDVRDFGAKGNGAEDDTKAIQTAVNTVASPGTGSITAGVIIIPNGDYVISNTIELHQQALLIQGAGRINTRIRWNGLPGQPMFHVVDCSQTIFRDLNLLGHSTNLPSAAIFADQPTLNIIGRNEFLTIQRVTIGRILSAQSEPVFPLERGIWIGGASNTNNDKFTIEDVLVGNCTIAGYQTDNTNSIWGNLRNVQFQACATGISSGANTQAWNITFGGSTVVDIDVKDNSRLHVYGYYSENAELLWNQSRNASLTIYGGKAIVRAGLNGLPWAQSIVNNRNILHIEDLFISNASAPTTFLAIDGVNNNTVIGYARIRSSELPQGEASAGYVVTTFIGGNPVFVDIRQGEFTRLETVQPPL